MPVARYYRTLFAMEYLEQNGHIERFEKGELTRDDLLLIVVSILICDDEGSYLMGELTSALDDPSIVNAADHVLRKKGI